MRKIFWFLTLAWTVMAGVYLVRIVVTATTATELTAGAVLSLATALIPFVFTCCLEGIRHDDIVRVRIVGHDRLIPAEWRPNEFDNIGGEHAPRSGPH